MSLFSKFIHKRKIIIQDLPAIVYDEIPNPDNRSKSHTNLGFLYLMQM